MIPGNKLVTISFKLIYYHHEHYRNTRDFLSIKVQNAGGTISDLSNVTVIFLPTSLYHVRLHINNEYIKENIYPFTYKFKENYI